MYIWFLNIVLLIVQTSFSAAHWLTIVFTCMLINLNNCPLRPKLLVILVFLDTFILLCIYTINISIYLGAWQNECI
jgi:hypothetical protein